MPVSAQGPDGSYILDSLRATTTCPDVPPVIHHLEWEVPADDACILVAVALRELAQHRDTLPEFVDVDTSLVSEASVYVETLTSQSGQVHEAAWRVLLDVRGHPQLFWMTIDQRTGWTRFGAVHRPTRGTGDP